jgi:hypothetical protein
MNKSRLNNKIILSDIGGWTFLKWSGLMIKIRVNKNADGLDLRFFYGNNRQIKNSKSLHIY